MNNFSYVSFLLTSIIIVMGLLYSGVYLIVNAHYGWAWIPFVLILCFGENTLKTKNK